MHVNQRRTNLIRLQLIAKINNNKALKMFVGHYYCHVYHNRMKLYLMEPRALSYRTDCTGRSKFLTHALYVMYILNFVGISDPLLDEFQIEKKPRIFFIFIYKANKFL